ncbi:MAG: hypothetical protein ABW221_01220 [Vicinamibacteria bacterium]
MILALLLALQASAPVPSYDELVAAGIAEARAGRTGAARQVLDRAVLLDPARPEAWVERSGVDFLEKRYREAADGLARALALRDDAYARELRASALALQGRTVEALAEWNRLGAPVVGTVAIEGLARTHDRVARREVAAAEGALLRADAFRETRLRLREVGVFPRVRLRLVPRERGRADLAVALTERHGFGPWRVLAVTAAADLAREQVRLGYFDLGGAGVVVRAEYKWERTQPRVAGQIAWPRPLGLPAKLLVSGLRARPTYRFGGGDLVTLRTRGVDLALRRVIGPRTVVEAGWRRRVRTFDAVLPGAPSGGLSAATAAVEHALVDGPRDRLEVRLRAHVAAEALGSAVRYSQGAAAVRYERALGDDAEETLATGFAARALYGWGGDGTPLDAMFAAGAGAESELPLRGHDLKEGGVLGASPIARALLLVNLEWRQRIVTRHGLGLAVAGFTDVARPSRSVGGDDRLLADAGIGLRVAAGGTVFRVDQGWSLSRDGRSALSAGFGRSF